MPRQTTCRGRGVRRNPRPRRSLLAIVLHRRSLVTGRSRRHRNPDRRDTWRAGPYRNRDREPSVHPWSGCPLRTGQGCLCARWQASWHPDAQHRRRKPASVRLCRKVREPWLHRLLVKRLHWVSRSLLQVSVVRTFSATAQRLLDGALPLPRRRSASRTVLLKSWMSDVKLL